MHNGSTNHSEQRILDRIFGMPQTAQKSLAIGLDGPLENFHVQNEVRPKCTLHADANTGHAFGIFMASVGALRLRLRRR